MGGYGSGWPMWKSKKQTVEDSLPLSIDYLVQQGYIRAGVWSSGSLWWNSRASISFQARCEDNDGELTLDYKVHDHPTRYAIPLVTTRPHFGGLRWWCLCPSCGCRAAKLYLPVGSGMFACRQCHDLTYQSCQESDKRLSAFRRMSPDEMLARLQGIGESSTTDLLLMLKAIDFGND